MGTPSDAMPAHKIQSEGVVYLPDSGERAPMSIVWTTLPGISAVLPLIGHVGIADSKGVIYDFSGPYQVSALFAFFFSFLSLSRTYGKCTSIGNL